MGVEEKNKSGGHKSTEVWKSLSAAIRNAKIGASPRPDICPLSTCCYSPESGELSFS